MNKYEILFKNLEEISVKALTKTTIKCLKKLGINNLYNLFYYFPKNYENRASYKKISSILNDENVALKGQITHTSTKYLASNRTMFTALLSDGTAFIELLWFNNKYIKNSIKIGDDITVIGKAKKTNKLQMVNPSYRKNSNVAEIYKEASLEPIYSLTKGLTQKKLREIIKNAIDKYVYLLQENIPLDFVYNYKIMSRQKALFNIHFPKNQEILDLSIRRFTYEEIMILEMNILKNKYINSEENINNYTIGDSKKLVKEYINNLNFELTNAQKKVIASIYKELMSGKIINRLIQGDVGSGKTIVAMIIMLYIAENKMQSVLMAPTEILAIQHYNNIKEQFKKLDIRVELLVSSIKQSAKKKIIEGIKEGKVDIVIGTHALIDEKVQFKNLSLTVIDEQHKFGVKQRNELREKSTIANIIVMSATPIPRSLALTIYGDLDVSIINEMPKGRKIVTTKWIKNEIDANKMYEFIKKKLEKKQQVYVVAPLIEKSKKLKLDSVDVVFEEMENIFIGYKIALLHGKLSNKEKDEIMNNFKNHNIDILISTTVIEVGVDVSNANIMIIKSAERFGLSSLHQLRGRVGRGSEKAYCFLDSRTENELSSKRLSIMESENDGFKIAEEDLKLRNFGEIFGVRQSGVPDLVLLDIVNNIKEIEQVKEFVYEYLKENKGIIQNEYLMKDIIEKSKIGDTE